jgi:alcohol dehydrogenase class IV
LENNMWFFSSQRIVFGEGALSNLGTVDGNRAYIVTDVNLVNLGYVEKIREILAPKGKEITVFDQVETDPSIETVKTGAERMSEFEPDLVIALGGGSVIDAAKGMWILYEHPGYNPESINPIDEIRLRVKAHFVAIPTTTGTGSEATWAIVLTDYSERRKLGLGNQAVLPDLAILDPELIRNLPKYITAETGLDTLAHAIEGFTCTYANDFCDGLCLQATRLVFEYLPRCFQDGEDSEARTHMQNAAAIAGLGFGNSMAALAHGMGHALGGTFHVPHGRSVGIFLPYTIEYCRHTNEDRYAVLAAFLGLKERDEQDPATCLVKAIRKLEREIDQPLNLSDAGINRELFEREFDHLIANAMNDTQTILSTRIPDEKDLRRLFHYAFIGKEVDF